MSTLIGGTTTLVREHKFEYFGPEIAAAAEKRVAELEDEIATLAAVLDAGSDLAAEAFSLQLATMLADRFSYDNAMQAEYAEKMYVPVTQFENGWQSGGSPVTITPDRHATAGVVVRVDESLWVELLKAAHTLRDLAERRAKLLSQAATYKSQGFRRDFDLTLDDVAYFGLDRHTEEGGASA